MSILVTNDGSRLVDTIADRDEIVKRFNNMRVHVRDVTADPRFGTGSAQYVWDADIEVWTPVWSSHKGELKFATEEKIIVDGQVQTDFVMVDDQVWSAKVLNADNEVLGDAIPVVSGRLLVLNTTDYDGHKLRYTYAHGEMSTAMAEIWDSKAGLLSPEFEGVPKAPTAAVGTEDGQLATTAFTAGTLKDAGFSYTPENGWTPPAADTSSLVEEAPADDKSYVRVNGEWAEQQVPEVPVQEAPTDGENYLRKDGEWATLDRYTLKAAATVDQLDLAEQQVFTVNASSNRTLSFVNAPGANRAMTVVVKVLGSAGTITWPTGIVWNNDTAPVLGATFTVVVLLWDGTSWVGSTGSTS